MGAGETQNLDQDRPKHWRSGVLPRVLTAQIVAFALILGASILITVLFPTLKPPTWTLALVQGVLAASISHLLGLKGWWKGAQFALPILAWGGLFFQLPPWMFLVAFVLLFLIYSNTSKEQVPLYLSNRTTWAALSELVKQETLPLQGGERPQFVDLGCGLGGTLAYLARAHPDWDIVGVENAPGPYLVSKLRVLGCSNASVRFASLWDTDLSRFDVVYAFLSPAPMSRLLDLCSQNLKEGALLISNSFWASDQPYDGEAEVNDGRSTRLFFKRQIKKS